MTKNDPYREPDWEAKCRATEIALAEITSKQKSERKLMKIKIPREIKVAVIIALVACPIPVVWCWWFPAGISNAILAVIVAIAALEYSETASKDNK